MRRLHNISEAIASNGVNNLKKIAGASPPLTNRHHTSTSTVSSPRKVNKTSKYWRPPQVVPKVVPKVVPTVQNKSTSSSSFGLNKLSYVGPIVMGIGGFVIVAACVMTFEARDSAAKIVPARFRKTFPERSDTEDDPGVRHSAAQTKWETLGVYGAELVRFHQEKELSRRAMTSAFIRFSKTIQSSMDSSTEYYEFRGGHRGSLIKCPSAPSLIREFQQEEKRSIEAPRILRVSAFPKPPPRRRLSSNVYPRQTMSVDNPAIREVYTASYPAFIGERGDEDMELGASATGVHRVNSDASLALDLHLPQCAAITLSVRDNSRSPSSHIEPDDTRECTSPRIETPLSLSNEEKAGPSGVHSFHINITRPKADKQTSTSDYNNLDMLGWSRDTCESKEGVGFTSRTIAGGSFRENRKKTKKVKRSETIDTGSNLHRRHHKHQRSRTGSIKSNADGPKVTPIRSETARRHLLLRQQKIETTDIGHESTSAIE